MSRARSGDRLARITGTSEVSRVLMSGACGLLVSVALTLVAPWEIMVLSGWIVAAATFVARTWLRAHGLTAAETAAVATFEDASRASAHLMVNGASVVSLVGVGVTLAEASLRSGGSKALFSGVAILTVITSWVLVHTVFTLRYAHAYYGHPVGGIDFNSDEAPNYHDFAYVAFTIGMTFQVSDTELTSAVLRRVALRHALLSYLFGAVILAMTINVTASFVL